MRKLRHCGVLHPASQWAHDVALWVCTALGSVSEGQRACFPLGREDFRGVIALPKGSHLVPPQLCSWETQGTFFYLKGICRHLMSLTPAVAPSLTGPSPPYLPGTAAPHPTSYLPGQSVGCTQALSASQPWAGLPDITINRAAPGAEGS